MLKELPCESVVLLTEIIKMPQTPLIGAPGVEAAWRLAHYAPLLGGGNGRGDRYRDGIGDFVLHCKNVGEIEIAAFGPDMLAGFRLD